MEKVQNAKKVFLLLLYWLHNHTHYIATTLSFVLLFVPTVAATSPWHLTWHYVPGETVRTMRRMNLIKKKRWTFFIWLLLTIFNLVFDDIGLPVENIFLLWDCPDVGRWQQEGRVHKSLFVKKLVFQPNIFARDFFFNHRPKNTDNQCPTQCPP